MCTGIDLVEQQLRVAAGEGLSAAVTRAQASGHSMEARLCAEDPVEDFAPTTGEIKNLRWPTVAPGALRVETGLAQNATITADSDPLVAQMVTYSQTRHQALLTLDRVLAETVVEPLVTNLAFLRRVLADDSFRAGQYDCEIIPRLSQ
jgi:acetyl/propionyl-CoA carboxylase alpha subunit